MFRSPKIHKKAYPRASSKNKSNSSAKGLEGAPLYYDCATDDARLTLETALDAQIMARLLRHTRVFFRLSRKMHVLSVFVFAMRLVEKSLTFMHNRL